MMRRRVTRKEIAERAGVSIATVDRVINRRAAVRGPTATRVQSAAEALGYKPAGSVNSDWNHATGQIRCGFLLQRRDSLFYQHLADELELALRHDTSLMAQLTIEFMDDYLEPSKVAERMRSMGGRVDALAVVATESPYVADAIDVLKEQQIPVVALLTDLSASNLAGYVGVDNRMAGRTAAWAIAHRGRPGTVGVLIGSHGYLGQEDREIGFRSYFREKAPDFKVLEPLVCRDDPGMAYRQTLEMLKSSENLVGIYTVGGGRVGTIQALEEIRPSPMPTHVCHELTALTRPGLIAGTIDLILDHDLSRLAHSAIKMLIDIKAAVPGKKQSAIVPFTIYTSENI
ncbi:MAG: LacI family transcriptional regulator [Verrucomicrobiota bacterium]